MSLNFEKTILLAILMCTTLIAAEYLKPTIYMSTLNKPIQLERIIPKQIGDWQSEENLSSFVINPQEAEVLKKIYTETLSRTYANNAGSKIMLSIAYGKDQRADTAAHYPEVCYPAQGFIVNSNKIGTINTSWGNIPVRRIETQMGNQRIEPVTYWVTIGEKITLGGFDRRMKELNYGLHGKIPDGLLVRVSSINSDSKKAFVDHEAFINALIGSLSEDNRLRITGKL